MEAGSVLRTYQWLLVASVDLGNGRVVHMDTDGTYQAVPGASRRDVYREIREHTRMQAVERLGPVRSFDVTFFSLERDEL